MKTTGSVVTFFLQAFTFKTVPVWFFYFLKLLQLLGNIKREVVNEFHACAVGGIITASVFGLAVEDEDQESEDADDELGGLFRVSRPDKASKQKANALDCSKFLVEKPQDWDLEEVMSLDNCFCMSCLVLCMSWLCLIKYG